MHLWQREIIILFTSSATTELTLRATGGLGVHLGIRARFLPKAELATERDDGGGRSLGAAAADSSSTAAVRTS